MKFNERARNLLKIQYTILRINCQIEHAHTALKKSKSYLPMRLLGGLLVNHLFVRMVIKKALYRVHR
jgi:hypothetical protein